MGQVYIFCRPKQLQRGQITNASVFFFPLVKFVGLDVYQGIQGACILYVDVDVQVPRSNVWVGQLTGNRRVDYRFR